MNNPEKNFAPEMQKKGIKGQLAVVNSKKRKLPDTADLGKFHLCVVWYHITRFTHHKAKFSLSKTRRVYRYAHVA